MSVWTDRVALDAASSLERVVLERLQVAAQSGVTGQMLRDATVDVRPMLADGLIVQLRSYVLAEHLDSHTQTATVRTPATWWDHWKHTHPWLHRASLRVFWSGAGWHHPRLGRTLTRWLWIRPPDYRRHTLTTTWTERAVHPYATLPLPDERLGPAVFWRTASSHLEDPR